VIEKMINKDYEGIFNMIENPSNEIEKSNKMKQGFPLYIEAIFTTEISNEEGITVGVIKNY